MEPRRSDTAEVPESLDVARDGAACDSGSAGDNQDWSVFQPEDSFLFGNEDGAPSELRGRLPFEEAVELSTHTEALDGLEDWALDALTDTVAEDLNPDPLNGDEFSVAMAFAEDTLVFERVRAPELDAPATSPATVTHSSPDLDAEDEVMWAGFGAGAFAVRLPEAATEGFAFLGAVKRHGASPSVNDPETAPGADGASLAGDFFGCRAPPWIGWAAQATAEPFSFQRKYFMSIGVSRSLDVQLTRQEARAFARSARWGLLRTNADADAFLFMAEALSDATAACTGLFDADVALCDWGQTTTTSVDLDPPEGFASPLEAAPEDIQIIDDLGDDPRWNDTFWQVVDQYLTEQGGECALPSADDTAPIVSEDFDIVTQSAVHFWSPGDSFEQVVTGQGGDIFLVGVDEAASVFLVEDGLSHAMRTGAQTPINAVALSVSLDAWTDIDSMHWRTVATMTGVAHVRIDQNAADTRRVVVVGDLCATDLVESQVRLERFSEFGDISSSVIRVRGCALGDEDQVPLAGRPAGAAQDCVALDF